MNEDERFDALVGSLYDAALDPAHWSSSLVEIANQCHADNIHLLVWDPTRHEPSFSLAPGMNQDMEVAYQAHYGAIDPRRLLVSQLDAGKWIACHHHFDSRTVDRSEFYQDYLIPGDIRYLLGTRLTRCGGLDVFLGMHRAPGRKPFSATELSLMGRLTGHFQKAARIWLSTEDLRQRAAIGEHAMDAMELGIVAVGIGGSLKYANRYAETILRSGKVLTVRQGVLAAATQGDAHLLDEALLQVATSHHSQSLRLGGARPNEADLCHVAIVPAGSTGPLALRIGSANLLVLITQVGHRRTTTVQQLMMTFGLTPAEARLARSIGSGESLRSYAESSKLSINTLKTQLKCVFAKTGTTRQADLTKLIAIIPVLRERSSDQGDA